MQCIILAAGRGRRMRELTDACPKPMLPINNRPKLAYTIEMLPKEIDEVILVVGYLKEQFIQYFGNLYDGRKITYLKQETLNGTGGAVTLAKDLINGRFLVLNGDDLYLTSDIEKLMKYDLALLAIPSDEVKNSAIIQMKGGEKLNAIIESPHGHNEGLTNIGAYMLDERFFDYPLVPKTQGSPEFGLPQTIVGMTKDHDVEVVVAQKWHPIGNPEDLSSAHSVVDEYSKKIQDQNPNSAKK